MNRKKKILQTYGKVLVELITNIRLLTALLFVFLFFSVLKEYIFLDFISYITNTAEQIINQTNIDYYLYLGYVLVYLIIFFFFFLISQCTSLVKVKYMAGIERYINMKMKNKLSKVQYESYESVQVGEKIKRVSEGLIKGYGSAVESIVRIVELLLVVIVYITFLAKYNILFALLVTISVLLSGLLVTKMSSHQYKTVVNLTNVNQKRDYLYEVSSSKEAHQEHQSNRLFTFMLERYTKAYSKASKGYLKVHAYTIFAESRALILFVIVMFIAYAYTIYLVVNQKQEIGILISLFFIFDTLFNKASSLSYYISNRVMDLLCVREFYELMDLPEETAATLDESNSQLDTEIEFKKVSYKYPQSDKLALNAIDVLIKKNEKVAIVGINGSGKTTFSNILLGLLSNYSGEIRIGSHNYNRNHTIPAGYVKSMHQDFNTFQMSFRDNILLGKEGTSNKELNQILETIELKEYLEKLSKYYDTEIGQLADDGVEISRGQAQKLAAGRLLADTKSNIWILDEPTAYMDPLAEIAMYDFFYRIGIEKTILFISHRLGFAKRADRILVFDNGMIIEDGTHDELMKRNGKYTQMFLSQKQWYEEEI